LKLAEISTVHVLGFVEDEHCFSFASFLKTQIAQLLGPSFGVNYCYVFSEVFFLMLTTFLTRLRMIHGRMFTLQMGMADMHEIQILKFG